MYKWVGELRLLRRYIGSGAVNTLVGVAVIVGLTWLGLNPFLANAIGYVVGLITGYVASRFYTFQSRGPVGQETARYLTAFGPDQLWRLVAYRREYPKRRKFVYRDDIL